VIRVLVLLLALATIVRAETFPIVAVKDGFLLGAAGAGKWLPVEKAAGTVKGGEQYTLYSLTNRLGVAKGGKPHSAGEPCPDQEMISLTPKPEHAVIAFAAPWNALPRVPKMQDTTQAVYQKVVADFLASKGIRDPKVRITQIMRVDLDGKGEDAVLISATNYFTNDGTVPSSTRSGSYSVVLLRRITKGKVDTQLIEGEFYPKAKQFSAPNSYHIAAVLDFAGDGRMEVIVESNYYEGGGMAVYRVSGTKPELLLQIGCGA
jgi:hypothetical protein